MADSATDGIEDIPLKGRKCLICMRPVLARFRPFCSKRCGDRDLGNWLTEEYKFASEDVPDLDEEYPVDI
jgi:endogenous inhibitor of DNA gyrase (YacG/DUF329 family)